jgi:hypothetical protein
VVRVIFISRSSSGSSNSLIGMIPPGINEYNRIFSRLGRLITTDPIFERYPVSLIW